MQYRNLKDMKVSSICLGTMTFGTPVGESDAIKLIHSAIDEGVNFIDTANMYEGYARHIGSAGGVAEEILGKALAGKHDKVVLATKVGMKVGDQPEDEGTSPAAIRKQLEKSLKRLDTETIDIYYLHKPDPETPLEQTLITLDEVIREGKIRYYGISNYSADQLKKLLETADKNGLPRPVICQPPLSLLRQDVLADLIPLCKKENISVIPYQVLQGGVLTGKYRRGQKIPEGSRKAEKPQWVSVELNDELFDKLEAMEALAMKKNMTLAQYVVSWTLFLSNVVSVIIGAKRIEQIKDFVDMPEKIFSEGDIQKINELFPAQ